MSEQNEILENIEENIIEQTAKKDFKEFLSDYIYLAGIAGSILLLDQWTKTLVRTSLTFGDSWMPLEWLAPYLRIVHWRNTGAAFGIFQQGSVLFTILAIVVTLVIIYYFPQVPKKEWPLRIAMSMQLGGAMGNLVDRLQLGHVTDFIAVGNFPVFNVADSSITVGAVILFVGIWILERQEKLKQKQNELEGTTISE
ncbi:MAG: signal peptidase II [Chloroflexota bacterium]